MNETTSSQIKDFYRNYHDKITSKRHQSSSWIRRYAHQGILDGFLARVPPGATALDAGCGDGMLALQLAKKGVRVTGVDLSAPNIDFAKKQAQELGLEVDFLQGDVAELPFADRSFDYVVSSHVLEHLPDVQQGAREIARVTRRHALIAMPTCLNPGALTLLGRDCYWKLSWRSAAGLPYGIARTLSAWVQGQEGPNEGYAGREDLPHIWRFPQKMRKHLEAAGLEVKEWEAGPLLIPYLPEYVPAFRKVQIGLDRHRTKPVLKYLGYGSLAICERKL